MSVFEDLTPYTYLAEEGGSGTVLTVGWLGRDSRFEVGEPEPGLVDSLLALTAFRPVNTTRGFHLCELCDRPPDAEPEPLVVPYPAAERGEVLLGSAEVRVPGPDGIVYAAPTLVAHYVDRHHYRPPEAFRYAALALATADHRAWAEAKRALPVGTAVRGVVADRFLSGLYVTVQDLPDLTAFVPADAYRPGGTNTDPSAFPDTGTPLDAVVTGHAERGRRILLRVGPA